MTTQSRLQSLATAAMNGATELRFLAESLQGVDQDRLESLAHAIESALLAVAGGSRRSDRDIGRELTAGASIIMACRPAPKTRAQLVCEVTRALPGVTTEQAEAAFDQVVSERVIVKTEDGDKWRPAW